MKRHPQNPLITRADIPDIRPELRDVSSVFNPGATKYGEEYALLLRVQNRGRETFFLTAFSENGVDFRVSDAIVEMKGIERITETVYHLYDARITALDNSYYLLFAMDTDGGCRLGLARTDDFSEFEFLGIVASDDTRNGVLFPEKINGKYARLERPNVVHHDALQISGDTIVLSESDDLLHWSNRGTLMRGRLHYWDELIGPGPPPLKTERGWLQIYHGIATHLSSYYLYQAGLVLLDLENPLNIIHRSRYNILEPRELYEQVGQVPNVIFPTGLIADNVGSDGFVAPDSTLFLYYGAADTSVCLATTTVDELLELALS